MMARLDPYGVSLREEQKAVINALLGIIYDNYDTTRRIQTTVDSMYKMVLTMLIIIILLVVGGIMALCYFGCRRYQQERNVPLHQQTAGGRKPTPIEI